MVLLDKFLQMRWTKTNAGAKMSEAHPALEERLNWRPLSRYQKEVVYGATGNWPGVRDRFAEIKNGGMPKLKVAVHLPQVNVDASVDGDVFNLVHAYVVALSYHPDTPLNTDSVPMYSARDVSEYLRRNQQVFARVPPGTVQDYDHCV